MTREELDKATENLRKIIEEKMKGIREVEKRVSISISDGRRK